MSTYKNETGAPVDIARYELRVGVGETFTIPDDDSSFEGRPGFTSSRVRNPDNVPDPAVVAAATGSIPVQSAPPVPQA